MGFDLKDIVVHPNYNPDTKANNVAAVSFNLEGKQDWEMDTAIDIGTWQARVYTQRHLKSIEGLVWDYPNYITEDKIEQDNACSDLSPIYSVNADKFTCTTTLATPLMTNSTACKIPYPVIYAQMGDELYQAGLYSHSVVKGGDNLCDNDEVRSYYTLIGDYLAFAETALNKKFTYHSNDNSSTPQTDPYYSMKNAPRSVADGTLMLSGDFYNSKAVVIASATASDSAITATGTDVKGEDATSDLSDGQSAADDSNGSSKKTIIIAAVCGSVGTLILVASILFGIRWYRGHVSKVHDPYQAPSAHEFLEEMFENADGSRPPPAYKPPGEAPAEEIQNANVTNNVSPTSPRYSGLNFPNDKDQQ
ncbi:hypothetical protein H4R20_002116 [Coemansia guatemalensis]|uniref:Uncharacterized protein n=1 Tax=Coemansia guatemalensis TaxID=2761395 RepID=A0A9W8LU97_9FUNG|nr:hypothetical protein H4R20_002116 [Coemansia guatemalensis]